MILGFGEMGDFSAPAGGYSPEVKLFAYQGL
jgi:hypothetical protein